MVSLMGLLLPYPGPALERAQLTLVVSLLSSAVPSCPYACCCLCHPFA